jgi:hypothetical protein
MNLRTLKTRLQRLEGDMHTKPPVMVKIDTDGNMTLYRAYKKSKAITAKKLKRLEAKRPCLIVRMQ